MAANNDRIIGFAIVNTDTIKSELITVVRVAMRANFPYTFLRDAILTHPTMAEGLGGPFANEPSLSNQAS